jgi:hypothetical protein
VRARSSTSRQWAASSCCVAGAESKWLELEFEAAASFVPGFLPVGDAGDAIAAAAIEAACDVLTR